MPIVTFIQPGLEDLCRDVASGTMLIDVVRPLVREGLLALAWRCGQGTCGACQVYCAHALSGHWIEISGKERNVLIRHAAQAPNMHLSIFDSPKQVRLACHYRIERDVTVSLEKM
ncbi:ferredoxin [Chitinibacter sp. S2-10]|uniref:ferredoxin n=1 Tax=Chitinibacter sp. S2-10 TaxID=3373597 RepID=UPI003977A5DA